MAGPHGYYNAPFSKFFTGLGIVLTLSRVSSGNKAGASLELMQMFQGRHFWDFLAYPFVYANIGELVVGTILIYQFRYLERSMGSEKYSVLILLSSLVGLPVLAAFSLMFTGMKFVSGPSISIFAALVHYYAHVPVVNKNYVGVCGLRFSEKAMVYLLALQLCLGSGAALPASVGLLFGLLYVSNPIGVQSLRYPSWFISGLRYLQPLFRTRVLPNRPRSIQLGPDASQTNNISERGAMGQVAAGLMQSMLHQHFFGGAATAQTQTPQDGAGTAIAPPPPPAEEDVTALEAMGFPREAAARALQRSGGNVERAAHRLLEDGAATRPPSAGAAGPPPLPVADVEPRASPATAVTTSHHHGGHTD